MKKYLVIHSSASKRLSLGKFPPKKGLEKDPRAKPYLVQNQMETGAKIEDKKYLTKWLLFVKFSNMFISKNKIIKRYSIKENLTWIRESEKKFYKPHVVEIDL